MSEGLIKIKCGKQIKDSSCKRLQGMKFKFLHKEWRWHSTSKKFLYLHLGFGVIPRKKMHLREGDKVILNYNLSKNIIIIEKDSKKHKESYTLNCLNPGSKSTSLRLRIRWLFYIPTNKELFGKPKYVGYEIKNKKLFIFLNKINISDNEGK